MGSTPKPKHLIFLYASLFLGFIQFLLLFLHSYCVNPVQRSPTAAHAASPWMSRSSPHRPLKTHPRDSFFTRLSILQTDRCPLAVSAYHPQASCLHKLKPRRRVGTSLHTSQAEAAITSLVKNNMEQMRFITRRAML